MTDTLEGGCACGGLRYRLQRDADVRALLPLPGLPAPDRHRLRAQRADRGRAGRRCCPASPGPTPCRPTAAGRTRVFRCPDCGTAVWSEYGGLTKLRFVRVGTLDDPAALAPDVHIYTRSKLPWVALPDGRAGVRGLLRFARALAGGEPGAAQGGAGVVGVHRGSTGCPRG